MTQNGIFSVLIQLLPAKQQLRKLIILSVKVSQWNR